MWKDHVTQLISIPFERIHYSIIPNQLSTQLRVNESPTMTFHHFQDRGATLQIVPILVLVGVNVIPKPRPFFVSGGVATLKIASYQGGKPGRNFRCWSILWEPNEPCVVVVLKNMLIGVENAKKGETCYDFLANPPIFWKWISVRNHHWFLGYLILAPT